MKVKTVLTALVFLGLIANGAQALPSSATASVSAEQQSDGGIRVTVTNTFDVAPDTGESCKVSIFGSVGEIGTADSRGLRRLATKTNLKRKVSRFRGDLAAVRLMTGTQTQLNIQSRATCRDASDNVVTIVSSADATNVTCSRGVSRRDFIVTLGRRLTFAGSSNAAAKAPTVRTNAAKVCRAK